MARRLRVSALVLTLATLTVAGLALAALSGAETAETLPAAQTAPAAAGPQPPAAEPQRVKRSEPPELALFFTDQAVGYIQPCG